MSAKLSNGLLLMLQRGGKFMVKFQTLWKHWGKKFTFSETFRKFPEIFYCFATLLAIVMKWESQFCKSIKLGSLHVEFALQNYCRF